MNPNYGLMVELKPNFQKELFTKLLRNYNRIELLKRLERSSSTLYHYKNCRIKGISLKVVNKAMKLANISDKDFSKNILKVYNSEDSVKQILRRGAEIRRNKIKLWKNEIPLVENIIKNKALLLEKWFDGYIKLIDFGAREFKSILKDGNKIELIYTNYSNSKKKTFINYLPAEIPLDNDFQYFFGLWCGDRLGRGRFGIANKNKEINFYTKYYLEKLYQKSEFILMYDHNIKKPKIDYEIDKVYIKKTGDIKGYCINVGIKNRIMFSFFDYLYKNLDMVLNSIPNKYIFFAGLFDAEGNILLEDKCFRWSCKNEEKVKIYIKHLKKLNLFRRYDGGNLVTYNKDIFSNKILPFLKHPEKINKANLICHNKGYLDNRFIDILDLIYKNPGITNSKLAKALKRVKRYSQSRFLENLGYIKSKNYPKQLFITMKGLKEIQGARI